MAGKQSEGDEVGGKQPEGEMGEQQPKVDEEKKSSRRGTKGEESILGRMML